VAGKRLFVGARVSVATANALAACAELLQRRARDASLELKWVAPVNYHVTVKFLGWTHDEAVGAVRDAVVAACSEASPFKFRTTRLGAFGSLERASVVWAGVEEAGALAELARRIDAATAALGFAGETRPFHAHVTLARLRDTKPVRELVLPVAEQMFGETRIDALALFESETRPSGSVYREVARLPLGVAPAEAVRPSSAADPAEDTDDGWPRGHGPA
jgi:2'-5' RNA ligase